MITLLRAAGMRFVIYTDDHEPAHLHVYGDGEARINIAQLAVISNRGMSKRDLTRALNIVLEYQEMFLNKWHDIHG
ncbi:DUF4160 domain-containing protein [Devosia sp. Root635]|uniref:DUF4160 domain-containing protein n=1 Tax=Devosia sp. Root635 TaxID=1736575 RepID=UPI0006FA254B|nr:DUF4160 domain-containing protein [Devosia sp. Root635]KRA55716.1 hypothetical protein ASD80_00040 [Devosia sp. Root635]